MINYSLFLLVFLLLNQFYKLIGKIASNTWTDSVSNSKGIFLHKGHFADMSFPANQSSIHFEWKTCLQGNFLTNVFVLNLYILYSSKHIQHTFSPNSSIQSWNNCLGQYFSNLSSVIADRSDEISYILPLLWKVDKDELYVEAGVCFSLSNFLQKNRKQAIQHKMPMDNIEISRALLISGER